MNMSNKIKWTRILGSEKIVDAAMEYSTCHIDKHHYITVSHAPWSKHYWYSYIAFENEVVQGSIDAESWDVAEELIVYSIKNKLMDEAALWRHRHNEFENFIDGVIDEADLCPSCGEELDLHDGEDNGFGELRMHWECKACGKIGYAVIDQHDNNAFVGHIVLE